MKEKLLNLFKIHLKAVHDLEFYDYQLEIAASIFEYVIQNMRLTSGATEEEIKKLKLNELGIEISRQAGKTTTIVHVVEFLMIYFTRAFGRPIEINLFAPQKEQAKTDFDRLKAALIKTTTFQVIHHNDERAKEESNARTIVLPNGSSCYIFPVVGSSKPESKSPDLMLFEESQDMDDKIVQQQIWPMGAAKNSPRIYIGTAGTKICYFYRLTQSDKALRLYFNDVVAQRRKKYLETTQAFPHLVYEQYVKQEIEKQGLESDEIQRPYFGKWLIGTGQYVTQEILDELFTDRKRTYHERQSDCYVGIDVAKHPDSTVVTVLRYNPEAKKKQVLNWLELRGENYQDQFDIITGFDSRTGKFSDEGFLSKYKVIAVAIDSTGQGDFMPDLFQRHTEWQDENSGLYRIKFSAVSKDMMYKNLKVSIKELLTDLPKADTREADRFRQQMLDLQQEYKGQLLSVHHPDTGEFHDDYPDSWALAEWAYAKYNEDNNAQVVFVTSEQERKVTKDDEGNITNYWPGEDW